MQSTERWAPVVDWEDLYEVSDHGRLRRIDTMRVMKPTLKNDGHLFVGLSGGAGRKATYLLHRLVIIAFVGPAPEGMECCHNNGDALDNRLENLRWDTHAENIRDTVRHGANVNASKPHCKRGHEFDAENTLLQRNGKKRVCRTCMRAHQVAYKARVQNRQLAGALQ